MIQECFLYQNSALILKMFKKAFSHVNQRFLSFFTNPLHIIHTRISKILKSIFQYNSKVPLNFEYLHTYNFSKFSITSLGFLKCKLDPGVLYYMIELKYFCFFMGFFVFRSFLESVQRLSNKEDFLWEEEVAYETRPASERGC